MFIAVVMLIALTSALYGIELFKYSLINTDLLNQMDPDYELELLPFIDIIINTISLAFLADNSTVEG